MGQTTFYSKNYIGWPPVPVTAWADPDSWYWRERATSAEQRLVRERGEAWVMAWNDIKFPMSGPCYTWREYWEAANFELDHPAECDCTNRPEACLPCKVQNLINERI